MIKRLLPALALLICLIPSLAHADVPALKITPLEFRQNLPLATLKQGYVDVSNPTDGAIEVKSQVQAFRQVNDKGDLQFYDDPALQQAINIDLKDFEVGPRKAIRVAFTIDPNKVGRAGLYGVLFFQTVPPAANPDAKAQVSTSARVGSLLILTIGNGGVRQGKITKLHASRLQLGTKLTARADYKNVGASDKAIAFNPVLATKAAFSSSKKQAGGLVMPGVIRQIAVARAGSYIGLVPVRVADQTGGGSHKVIWVLACTGWFRLILPIVIILALIAVRYPYIRKNPKK